MQTARPVLYDAKLVNQMVEDIDTVDASNMAPQGVAMFLQGDDLSSREGINFI